MFSFHKPKVYRSTQGCCICKAKSSSSRFTDSKKYENDFIDCFQLDAPRKGEICNACVLLVKRFKRLPPGSERHWGHVVDARVGPGIKSMTKFKKRKEEQQGNSSPHPFNNGSSNGPSSKSSTTSVSERFDKIFKKTKKKKGIITRQKLRIENSPGSSDENSSPSSSLSNNSDNDEAIQPLSTNDYELAVITQMPMTTFNGQDAPSGRDDAFNTNENGFIDVDKQQQQQQQRQQSTRRYDRKSNRPLKNRNALRAIPFMIDQEFWMEIKTCCGYAYENQSINAIIINAYDATTQCAKHSHPTSVKKVDALSHTSKSRNYLNSNGVASTVHDFPPTNSYISKAASQPISLPSKKHHLLKSQGLLNQTNNQEICQPPDTSISQSNAINLSLDSGKCNITKSNGKLAANGTVDSTSTRAYNYLHKIKSDSGRIVKQSLDRMTASRIKVNDVKNLIKFCTDKSSNSKKIISNNKSGPANIGAQIAGNAGPIDANGITPKLAANENKVIEAIAGNKFNDNSSDSGYEETLHDTAQLNQIAKVGSSRPVILSNGIKLHVQPKNLLMAANLAGVSPSAIQTTQQNLLNQQFQQSLFADTNTTIDS